MQNLKEEEERQEQFEADEELLLIYNERVEAQVVKTKLEEANLALLNETTYSDLLYTPSPASHNVKKKAKKTTPHVVTPKSANSTPKGKVGRPRKNQITPKTTPNITTPSNIKPKPVNPYAIPYSRPAFRHVTLPGSSQPISSLNAVTHITIPARPGVPAHLIRKVFPAPQQKSPKKIQPHIQVKSKTITPPAGLKNNHKITTIRHINKSGEFLNKVMNPSVMNHSLDLHSSQQRVIQPQIIAGQIVPTPVVHSQSVQQPIMMSQPSQRIQIKMQTPKTGRPSKPAHIISRPSNTPQLISRPNNPAHLLASRPSLSTIQPKDKQPVRIHLRPAIRPSNSFMQQLNTANNSLLQSSQARKPRVSNPTIRIIRSPAFPNKKPLNPIVVNSVQQQTPLKQTHLRALSKPRTAQFQPRVIKTQQQPQQQQQSLFPLLDTLSTTNMKVIKTPVVITSTQPSPCYINASPVIRSATSSSQNCAPNLFDRFANIRHTSPIKVLPIVTMVPSISQVQPQLIPVALPSQYKIIRTLKSPQAISQVVNNQNGISIVRPIKPRVPSQTIRIQHPLQHPMQHIQRPAKH